MPHTSSQTFLRELFLRSGDIPVAGGRMMATGMSPLPRSHSADRPNGRINPRFNIKEWWDGKLECDARWSRSEAESASHAKFYKNQAKRSRPGAAALRDRRGETLFIDARKLSFMKGCVLRDYTAEDVEKIPGTFCAWRWGAYEDIYGFCKSASQ